MSGIKTVQLTMLALCIAVSASLANASQKNRTELSQVPTFSLGMNGFAGEISPGERIYTEILRSPQAAADFKSILASADATPEAKLYALCGLKSQNIGSDYLRKFAENEADAAVLIGDVLRRMLFRELAKRIIYDPDRCGEQ